MLVTIRIIYLFFYAAVGSQLPFLPLFLSQSNFTNSQIGILIGIQGLAVLVAPGVSSYIADTIHGGAKSVLIVCAFVSAISMGVLTLSSDFYFSLILILVYGLFFVPLFSLIDGITVTALRKELKDPAVYFSALRAFGTLGFIVPSLLLAPCFYYFNLDYRFALYLGVLFLFLLIMISLKIGEFSDRSIIEKQKFPLKDAFNALKERQLLLFTTANFFVAMSMGVYYSFFSIKLQLLSIPPFAIGLIYNIGPLMEAFFLFNGRFLIRKIGIPGLLVLAAVSGILRFFIISASENVYWIIFSMILHAPIIMSLAVLVNVFLDQNCKPGYRYSMLGLTQVLNGGIARLIGSLVGPLVVFANVPLISQNSTFFGFAAIFNVIALFFALKFWNIYRNKNLS